MRGPLVMGDYLHLSSLARFAIVMLLVVLLPKLMERFRLPGVLGFILVGVLLGPALAGFMKLDGEVIHFLSELGKVLFMFFVGFEINLAEFNKSRNRSLTFLLPFLFGIALARALGCGWNTSALVGSLIASHTLISFPLIQDLGLVKHPAVLTTIGGTIFTDIASMMVLALTVSIHQTGFSMSFLIREVIQLAIYVPLVLFGAGYVARRAIARYGDRPEIRVTILLIVIAVCAEGAALIQLEGIVGAFLAGIAVKRALRTNRDVEQLEITSHTIFIPAFFISTGLLLNFKVLWETIVARPLIVIGLIIALAAGKFLAAWLTCRAFPQLRGNESLIGSLSLPQMAATLATAVVANQTINSRGEPLLDLGYVNATLMIVILSCIVGPILTGRYARQTPVPSE